MKYLDCKTIKDSFRMVGLTEGINSNGRTISMNDPNTSHVLFNVGIIGNNFIFPKTNLLPDSFVRISMI